MCRSSWQSVKTLLASTFLPRALDTIPNTLSQAAVKMLWQEGSCFGPGDQSQFLDKAPGFAVHELDGARRDESLIALHGASGICAWISI